MFKKAKKFFDKDFRNFSKLKGKSKNVILSENLRIDLEKSFNNFLVVGSAGSGLTTSFMIPNILECNTNYFIVERGDIHHYTHEYLEKNGYTVKVLDFREGISLDDFNFIGKSIDDFHCFFEKTFKSCGFYYEDNCIEINSLLYKFFSKYYNSFSLIDFFYAYDLDSFNELFLNIFENSSLRLEYDNLKKSMDNSVLSKYFYIFKKCLSMIGIDKMKKEKSLNPFNIEDIYNKKFALFIRMDYSKPFLGDYVSSILIKEIVKEYMTFVKENRKTISFYIDEFIHILDYKDAELLFFIKNKYLKTFMSVHSLSRLLSLKGVNSEAILGSFDVITFLRDMDAHSYDFMIDKLIHEKDRDILRSIAPSVCMGHPLMRGRGYYLNCIFIPMGVNGQHIFLDKTFNIFDKDKYTELFKK